MARSIPFLIVLVTALGCSSGSGSGTAPFALVTIDAGLRDELALNQPITFRFTRDVDPASVTPDTVRIRLRPELAIPARGELRVEGSTVRFLPALPADLDDPVDAGLEPGADYRIDVAGGSVPRGVRAIDGTILDHGDVLEIRISSSSPPVYIDVVPGPPVVVATEPSMDGSGQSLAVDGVLRLDLSEAVRPSSVDERGAVELVLRGEGGGSSRLPFEVSLTQDVLSARLLVRPTRILPGDAVVEIHLSPVIRDLVGNPLESYRGTLRTGPGGGFSSALVLSFDDESSAELSTASWGQGSLLATAGPGGDGSDGTFEPAASLTIDTTATPLLQVRRFIVEEGVAVHVVGPRPLAVLAQEEIVIRGVLDASGGAGEDARGNDAPGSRGGDGGPGGGAGGGGGSPEADRARIEGEDGAGPEPGLSPLSGGGRGGEDSRQAGGAAGGGGGGNGEAGSGGANGQALGGYAVGDASLDPEHGFFLGGGGGGGGGADDDLVPADNDGGGGGGGGGGAIRLVSSDRVEISGAVTVIGGPGGRNAGAGGGGGGGAGGSLLIQGRTIELLPGGELDARGGEGGETAGFGDGGAGGAGRLRLEDEDGVVVLFPASTRPPKLEEEIVAPFALSRGAGVSFARSLFLAPRVLDPDYTFDASDPSSGRILAGDDVVRAGIWPAGAEAFVLFEGAPADPLDPGRPDLTRATGFTPDIDALDGLAFLRFELEFRLPASVDPFGLRFGIDTLTIRYALR